jgi:hypothetical protein
LHRYLRGVQQRTLYATSLLAIAALLIVLVPARSAAVKLTRDIVERDRGFRIGPARMAAATDGLRAQIGDLDGPVALVVVESWGVLQDSAAHAALADIFRTPAIAARYQLRTGTIPFRGGTTSGELRELCGVATDYLALNDAVIDGCLPNQLRRRGYRTVALHGYLPEYYSRHRWYPRFFDRMLFQDSLAQSDRRCGTQFRGVCDSEVFETFANEVRKGDRQLTYWLTIDAHTPVDVARMGELPVCGGITGWQDGTLPPPDFCLVVSFWADLFRRLEALAADPGVPPTHYIMVGDHAPAFVRTDRATHLVPNRVPYVELIPLTQGSRKPPEPKDEPPPGNSGPGPWAPARTRINDRARLSRVFICSRADESLIAPGYCKI